MGCSPKVPGDCVITEHSDGAQVLQGCLGGWVSNSSGDGVSVGVRELNSLSAELQAHLFARLLLVQSEFFGEVRDVQIGFDNMSAAAAAASFGTPCSELFVHKLCAACNVLLLKTRDITTFHVKGHSGHPWNDLADSVCTYFFKNRPSVFGHPLPTDAKSLYGFELLATVSCDSVSDDITIDENHEFKVQLGISSFEISQNVDSCPIGDVDVVVSICDIKCLQYNACSLGSVGSRKFVSEGFEKLKFHVGFFQESRYPKNRIMAQGNTLMCIASQKDGGSHGCEVLISLSLPFASVNSRKKYISRENVSIVFSSFRAIVVKVSSRYINFFAISAHAPYKGCKSDNPEVWWQKFVHDVVATCGKEFSKVPIICGIDGNVGTFESGSDLIGDIARKHTPPPSNFFGFCDFLNGLGLRPFNTSYEKCRFDYAIEPYTYQDKRGGFHVIDYVLGNHSVFCCDGSIGRVHEFLVDINVKDHYPVQFVVSWSASSRPIGHNSRKSLGYDPKKFLDVDCASLFQQLISDKASIPVSLDVTSHCHVIHSIIYDNMCQAFPKDKVSIKAVGVSSDHMSIFCKAREAKRNVGKSFARFRTCRVRACFGLWSGCCWKFRYSVVFGFGSLSNISAWISARSYARDMQGQVKGIVKRAFHAHVEEMTNSIVASFDSGPIKEVHDNIKRMFQFVDARSKTHKSSRVVGENGRPAQSLIDEKKVFRDHFCKVLSGSPQAFETLVCEDTMPDDRRMQSIDPTIAFDVIPSLFDFVSGFSKFKGGKAWGEGKLCSDVFKRFPFEIGQALYPLVLKVFSRVQPPLQWKWGVICELFPKQS